MGDLGMDEDRPYLPSFAAPLNNPDPNSIRVEAWVLAEDPTREVLNCIHPTLDSEEKRKDVIEFVQKLIRCNLRLEVFPYGSVPLKTYLPDGDIDLTVLSTPNLDEILPREVLRVLQEEEQNGNTEFEIKDTQFIDAEVKLVKCLVQDIVIDISFNQLGGLCTLCFLEQVDRLAGKDHLFKRSIILIKAWCYYESRILGAHHGLISTYALETLVLYIFHVFYASLNGPIEVLYRFLDYYAKFDWENYCVSLDGPVCKSSLPNLAVENADNQGTDVLLGAEFRKNCMDMFIVPSKGAETDPRAFFLKNLNIIDPLKENNNLGRSVNRGNYYRIQSAFRYGARRLGKILQLPNNNKIGDEIKMFFRNTLQRHRPKYGPDNALIAGVNGLHTLSISSRSGYEDDIYSRFSNGGFDDYVNDESINLSLENDRNTPPYNNFVDGDMICVCIDNKENHDILSESELLDPFSDLTGDYDAHLRSLLYGQGCHGHALSTNMVRASLSPSPPTSPYENRSPWDPVAHSWPKVNTNGVMMGPTHNGLVNGNKRASGNVVGRGTGPYIPVMRCNTCKDRTGPTRGRGRVARMQPHSNGHHHNQRARGRSVEPKLVIEANNHSTQFPLEWSPKKAQVNARSTQPNPSAVNSTGNGNGNGNVTNHTHKNPNPVNSIVNGNGNGNVTNHTHKNPNPVNSTVNGNGYVPNLTHKNPNPVNSTVSGNGNVSQPRKLEFGSFRSITDVNGRKQERNGENSFHLKNEDEFPPLSSA